MKTIRLYETTWGGNLAYQVQDSDFNTPQYLVWMERSNSDCALYQSSHNILLIFDRAGSIEEAKQKMQNNLLEWAKRHSKKHRIKLEEKIIEHS